MCLDVLKMFGGPLTFLDELEPSPLRGTQVETRAGNGATASDAKKALAVSSCDSL